VSGPTPEPSAVGAGRADPRDPTVRGDGGGEAGVLDPSGPSRRSVRSATHEDIPTVVEALQALLRELGGTLPPTSAMQAVARVLLDNPQAGALLVMEANGTLADADYNRAIVGVLGASWQTAIHVPGRYALIQDLWVHPDWRGRAIGHELLKALFERARELGIARVEVGLPPERFASLAATQAFYQANGFESLGLRMRRGLT
jgi:branched-chain amino acid aminotransferase